MKFYVCNKNIPEHLLQKCKYFPVYYSQKTDDQLNYCFCKGTDNAYYLLFNLLPDDELIVSIYAINSYTEDSNFHQLLKG